MPCYVPQELLFTEVLTRLPAKSLARFRCVSKSWSAQIYSPQFIQQHYNRRKSAKVILRGKVDLKNHNLYSIDLETIHDVTAKKLINPSAKYNWFPLQYPNEILGSCNGLLCLSFCPKYLLSDIIFLNPSTRKQWRLPAPPFPFYHCAARKFVENSYVFGFGYDEVADDYKLVVLTEIFSTTSDNEISHKLVVYSLKSNTWREVAIDDHPAFTKYIVGNGVFASNALHWLMKDCVSDNVFIVGLDLSSEKLSKLPPPKPEFGDDNTTDLASIGSLDGCLSAVFYSKINNEHAMVEVWMTNEYGCRKNSWAKLCLMKLPHVGMDRISVTPLAFLNDGSYRKLLLQSGIKSLVVYNLEENSTEIIDVGDELSRIVSCVCYDSLFQPCGGNGMMDRKEKLPR